MSGAAARRDHRCGKRGYERYQVNRLNVLAVGQSAGNVARRSPASLPGEHQDRARAQSSASITKSSAATAQDDALMPSCDNGRSFDRRAPQARHGVPLQAAQPSGRGPTSHASPRWRSGGSFTAPDAVRAPRDATTSTGPLRGRRSGPVGLRQPLGPPSRRRRIDWRTTTAPHRRMARDGAVLGT